MTFSVRPSEYGSGMPRPLQPGDELRCPPCRQWHPVVAQHSQGTPYTVRMRYWKCAKGWYFAGSLGTVSSRAASLSAKSTLQSALCNSSK